MTDVATWAMKERERLCSEDRPTAFYGADLYCSAHSHQGLFKFLFEKLQKAMNPIAEGFTGI